MKLHVLGSSSSGNGYLLYNEGEALVIEAGIKLKEVKQVLDFRLDVINGCIVSHRHQDHAGYIAEYNTAGIDVLAPEDVFTVKHHRNHAAIPGKGYKMGRFRIIPFEVTHDVTCYGYLINHPDCGRILFLTDTYLCQFKFSGLNHIIIEANYADDILESNIFSGVEHPAMRDRLLTSHLELKTTKAILLANDLNAVQNIVLIHLSDRNSDEQSFINEIIALTGKQVYAAKKGLTVDLAINPF
ncbi:MAG: MBL fold metallo-hydrolase [Bacteroidales bacterium]|nr:MBL fold metallo-hydrolase [Bacteroidales bacterium]